MIVFGLHVGGYTVKAGLVFPRVNLPVVIILHESQLCRLRL